VVKTLVVASIVWPMLLASGWWARAHDGSPWWSTAVYMSCSRICHQRPERSFRTDGTQWPVCGRCAGLYLAAPLGALVAAGSRRRLRGSAIVLLSIAAVPSLLTLVIEYAGLAPVSSLARALAALPLGAAIAFAIVDVVKPHDVVRDVVKPREPIE
jgi:uncharacterized membrane protein